MMYIETGDYAINLDYVAVIIYSKKDWQLDFVFTTEKIITICYDSEEDRNKAFSDITKHVCPKGD